MLAQSLLLPILDYADACYLDLTQAHLDKLERLQNVCIRFVFGLRKYDHVSEFRSKLKWLPIRLRRDVHILSSLHKIIYNPKTPSYLKERFHFRQETSSRELRPSYQLTLSCTSQKTKFYHNSFTSQAVRLWNELPLDIRKVESIACFKFKLKTHFLNSL